MENVPDMNITLFSFGYKHAPPEADTVIDVRFLPNPFYVPELSPKTGLDRDVASYVLDNPVADTFFQNFEPFLCSFINGHYNAERTTIRLAVGCTGGRHRSVAVTENIKNILEKQGVVVDSFHRDIDKV